MSTAINKPANEPYGYKIIHQPFDSEPRYFSGADYKFHFYSGTDDLPGDREFEVVREAIRKWNNIGGFSFRIQEESKPWLDLPVNFGRDYHSHFSWRYPWPSLINVLHGITEQQLQLLIFGLKFLVEKLMKLILLLMMTIL
jgi:hypothetical protein